MNLTLSIPPETAAKAKRLAASKGASLSAWFRDQVERETENERLLEIRATDSETADLVGSALPLETHWDDPRWRELAEKHLR